MDGCVLQHAPFYTTLVLLSKTTSSVPIPSQSIPTSIPIQPTVRHRQSISTATSTHSTTHTKPTPAIHFIPRIQPQSAWQLHAPEIRNTNSSARTSRQQTIQKSRLVNMPSITRPARRKRSTRIPPNRKAQGQRVTNCNLRIASMARNTIRRRGINRARARLPISRVDQKIQRVPHMQMGELQCPCQPYY